MEEFSNKAEYMIWVAKWKASYAALSITIRKARSEKRWTGWLKEQARDMLQERAEAKCEAQRLYVAARDAARRAGIAEHFAQYPLVLEDCAAIDMHFNKAHLQYPDTIPRWVVKTKGRTYYVHHIDSQVGWSSRELSEGSTLGMIRLRHCRLEIDEDGNARITEKVAIAA